jgi:hypothetical protein
MPTRKFTVSIVLCFVSFLLIYGVTSRADIQVCDEAAVFTSAISLATTGSLNIDNLRPLQASVSIGHEAPDGHLYTKYFPGNILGTAFIYFFAQRPADATYINFDYRPIPISFEFAPSDFGARLALRLNALLGAVGVTALYIYLLRRFDWKTSTITVLLFGLCTNWWYESRGLFSEIGAGTFLILSLAFTEVGSPSLSGLSLGLSVLFRPTNLLGIPIWLLGVWKKNWRSVWTGIFILLGLCTLLAYNWIRFKSFLDFGYVNEHFNGSIAEGLVGVLFSPGRSIFFYSPVLILCISGAILLYKYDRVLTITLLSVILGYLLSASLWHAWEGGESWGSRLVTPVLPLLAIFLAPNIKKALSTEPDKIRFYIILLAALGFGIQALTIAMNTMHVLYFYTSREPISYTDTIKSFQDSWLSLQIRHLQYWDICHIDSLSLKQLINQCK